MNKSTKIMISVVSAVVALCIVITTVVSVSKKKNNNSADPTNISSTASGQTDVSGTSAAVATTENAADLLKSQIVGKWMDSAGMSGYEFFDNGSANVTYVNLTVPVINMPINGTAKGTYTLDGDVLTVEFSIYKRTISEKYTASVESNTLSLVSKEDGEKSTYQRQTEDQVSTDSSGVTLPAEEANSIFGAWTDSGKTKKLLFREDGTMKVTTSSAEYDGVFLIEDDDITIQYAAGNGTLTEEYSFKISGNSMSFKDDKGQTILFVRDSGQSSSDLGLVGKWMDSSDMSGYTFKADGTVEITYVNFTVPVINMPINGKFGGTYAVDGDRITVRSSIYSKTVTNEYTFKIDGNNLTLTSVEDGTVHSYSRSAS